MLKPELGLFHVFRIKTLIKHEEEKSKRAETKMGQMLTGKEPEGYAECYPGMSEMNDAIDDSDDEADYSKMDLVSCHERYYAAISHYNTCDFKLGYAFF